MKECSRCFRCWDDGAEICSCDTPLDTSFPGPPILDGKYRIDRRIGRGGMGVVYRVHHLGLQKTFALKVIATLDETFRARFHAEAETLGQLKHPHIVEVTDFGIDARQGGIPYLVMEHLEGGTLADRLRRGPLTPEEALPIFESIAEAIDHAHERGVLHLDLKPSNVVLTGVDSVGRTVKILDFGLARFVGSPPAEPALVLPERVVGDGADGRRCPACGSGRSVDSTPDDPCPVCLLQWGLNAASPTAEDDDPAAPEAVDDEPLFAGPGAPSRQRCAGTVAYMAPEVLSGQTPASAADIYSFGILVYEVLAGRPPFQGSDTDVITGHCSAAPQPPTRLNPGLASELDEALLHALAKLPARRPRRAGDFVRQIRAALFRARVRTWRGKEIPRRIGIAVAVAVVLLLVSAPMGRLGLLQQIESRSIDARFLARPARAPDPRLILVTLDESSLAADPTPLAGKADEFGRHLQRVFEAGARGVAIDFLLPETWSQSKAFSDLILGYPDALTLASQSSPDGVVIGPECLNALTAAALGPARASNLFAFVNVDEDHDGVSRRARLRYLDDTGTQRDAWARRAVRTVADHGARRPESLERFWIDHSVDWRRFRRVSWKDLLPALEREPDLFRDRLVLVGGDFIGFGDYHRVPARPEPAEGVSGLILQALIANTILLGVPVREVAPATLLIGMGSAVIPLVLAFLLIPRWQVPALLAVVLVPVYVGASFLVFRSTQVLLPLVGPLVTAAGAILLATICRVVLPGFPERES